MVIESLKKRRRMNNNLIAFIILALLSVIVLCYFLFTGKLEASSLWDSADGNNVDGFNKPSAIELTPLIRTDDSLYVPYSVNTNQEGKTTCNNGRCTLEPGTYIQEDGQWKDWRDARSLKNDGRWVCNVIKNVSTDPDVICSDFNYTSRTLIISDASAKSSVSIPIKYEVPSLLSAKSYKNITTISLIDNKEQKEVLVNVPISYKVHVGGKSTIVTITNPSGYQIKSGDVSHYDNTWMLGGGDTSSIAITIDTSSIPDTATISGVEFAFMSGVNCIGAPICLSTEIDASIDSSGTFTIVNSSNFDSYGDGSTLTNIIQASPRVYSSGSITDYRHYFAPGSSQWGSISNPAVGFNSTQWIIGNSNATTDLQTKLSTDEFSFGVRAGNYWNENTGDAPQNAVRLRITYNAPIEINPYQTYNISATGNESKWLENVTLINNQLLITARGYFNITDGGTKYYIPRNLSIWDIEDNLIAITFNITSGEKDTFNYTLRGEEYLKIGNQSIYLIRMGSNGVLNNVTTENNFTHLTLSNSSIVLYLPFDINSTLTYDYSSNNNDGTQVATIWNASGKYGGDYIFDGTTSYLNIDDDNTLDFASGNVSMFAWIYSIGSTGDIQEIIDKRTVASPFTGYSLGLNASGSLSCTMRSTSTTGTYYSFKGNSLFGVLHHVGCVYNVNSKSWNTYVDGNLLASGTYTYIGTSLSNANPLAIGRWNGNDQYFNGTIDDVFIINTKLSSTDITNLYNSQFQKYFKQGSAMYNFTIVAGQNRLNVSSQINNIMGTNISLAVWDDVTDAWTSYQNITSLRNMTYTISSTATKINLSYLFLSDSYGFYTPEHLNNINIETWGGGVADTIYPIFSAYQDNNASLVDSGIGYFNVTVINSNGTVILNINGTTVVASNTTETLFNATYTFAVGGNYIYNWSAYGNGTSHNLNWSNNIWYTVNTTAIDTTAPNLTIVQLTDRNYTRRIIGLNYTTSADVANCWYRNGTEEVNYTLTCGTNATINYGADGSYTLWMFANDSSGNLNQTSRNFQIDTTSVSVTIVSPSTNPYYSNLTIDYNVTLDGNGTCSYSLDGFKNNITMTHFNDTYFNYTNLSITNGKWNINFSCIDTWGNLNMSVSRVYNMTISGDSTPPWFTTIPPSATITYGQNFGVGFTATDNVALQNYTVNWTTWFKINGSGWLYNITPLSAGTYNLNVSINDTNGNRNETIFNLTINQATGNVTLKVNHTSKNFTSYNNTILGYETWLNATLINGTGNIEIWINGTLYNNETSPTSNYTNLTFGYYNASAVYLGNTNYTSYVETWWINITMTQAPAVDASYPIFSNFLLSPANSSEYNYGRTYWFNITLANTNGTAGIEFNGVNYSLTNSSNNFTIAYSLGVGNYPYYFWAYGNGTTKLYNHTELNYYKVKINSSFVLGLSVTSPVEYPFTSNFAGSENNLGDGGCSYSLNITNAVFSAGTTSANYSTAGCLNYTSGSITATQTININTSLALSITGTTPINYGTLTDVAGVGCPSQLTCSFNVSNNRFSAGVTNFNYSTGGNTNYSSTSALKAITTNQNTTWIPTISASPSWIENNATEVTITGIGCPSGLVCSLSRRGTPVSNPDIQTLTGGLYNYTYNGTNTNYSYKIVSNILNITNTTSAPDTTPPTWTNCRNFSQQANISFSQSITATDASGIGQYRLNYTAIFNVTWGTGAIYNVSKLDTLQLYNLNLTVNDTVGNRASCFFWINITGIIIAPPVTYKTTCPELLFGYYSARLPQIRKCS